MLDISVFPCYCLFGLTSSINYVTQRARLREVTSILAFPLPDGLHKLDQTASHTALHSGHFAWLSTK